MTPEIQRIIIAEIEGFKRIGMVSGSTQLMGELPPLRGWIPIPDYPNDLNACHEMERSLTFEQAGRYERLLVEVSRPKDGSIPPPSYGYEAKHRTEAFLRLHGKWKESC